MEGNLLAFKQYIYYFSYLNIPMVFKISDFLLWYMARLYNT